MFRLKYLPLLFAPILFVLYVIMGVDTAVSTGHFIDSGQLLSNRPSYDVALGDLDDDTDLDAFIANFGTGGNANTVWLNDGNGTFTDSGQQLGSNDSYHVSLGDVDNDGDLDAFIGNSGANTVWLNQGGLQGGTPGTFNDSGQALGMGASWDVALGDIDSDGDLDAVVANADTNYPDKVWLNQGGDQNGTLGVFSDSGQTLDMRASGGVALGDVDGDTDLDAFITHFGAAPNGDRVWLNDGSGNFSDSGQILGNNGSSGVVLADLDGDNDLDAFVGYTFWGSTFNTVWLNQGGMQGGTAGEFQGNGQADINGQTINIALGDVDEDGDIDAFLPHYFNNGGNTVWLNDGNAQFSNSGQSLGNSSSYSAALGDVDGDLDLDAFTANYGNGVIGQSNKVWLNLDNPPTNSADLSVTMNGHLSVLDHQTTFNIQVQNLGPQPAGFINIEISSSGAAVLWSGSASQGSCTMPPDASNGLCLLGEIASGNTAAITVDATLPKDDTKIYLGTSSLFAHANSTTLDPDLSNNSDEFTTHFYNCSADDACVLDNIVCALFEIYPPRSPGNMSGDMYAAQLAGSHGRLGEYIPELALYYHLRDEIFTTPAGHHYRTLYYTHSDEVKDLIFADSALWDLALNGLFQWEPNLSALVAGEGDSVVISAAQVQAAEDFLDALSAAGSPVLQQAIATERANLPPPHTFVGMTMEEARGEIIGYAVYLPIGMK